MSSAETHTHPKNAEYGKQTTSSVVFFIDSMLFLCCLIKTAGKAEKHITYDFYKHKSAVSQPTPHVALIITVLFTLTSHLIR